MSWEIFVKKTTNEINNGCPLPSYFGSISLLFPQNNIKENNIQKTLAKETTLDSSDELISINSARLPIKPTQILQTEPKSIEIVNEKKKIENESSASWEESLSRRTQPQIKRPPPAFSDSNNSEESVPISRNKFEEEENILEKDNNEFYEEEEEEIIENQNNNLNNFNYSSVFRNLGDVVYGKFWAPIETIIPRLTLDSKLMTSFRTKKYNRLFKTMNEKYQNPGSNKLQFRRKTQFEIE